MSDPTPEQIAAARVSFLLEVQYGLTTPLTDAGLVLSAALDAANAERKDAIGALDDAGVHRNDADDVASGIEELAKDRDEIARLWADVCDLFWPNREQDDAFGVEDVREAVEAREQRGDVAEAALDAAQKEITRLSTVEWAGTRTACKCGSLFTPPKQTGMSVPERTCPACRRADAAEGEIAEQRGANILNRVATRDAIARAEIAEAALKRITERRFPIQHGPSILWSVIAPHDAQARRNHSQTLERLAERGGLDPVEAMAVYEDREYPIGATREQMTTAHAAWRALVERTDLAARLPAGAFVVVTDSSETRERLTRAMVSSTPTRLLIGGASIDCADADAAKEMASRISDGVIAALQGAA